eukprot:356457-Chlamydomonas_euryale.AAC.3
MEAPSSTQPFSIVAFHVSTGAPSVPCLGKSLPARKLFVNAAALRLTGMCTRVVPGCGGVHADRHAHEGGTATHPDGHAHEGGTATHPDGHAREGGTATHPDGHVREGGTTRNASAEYVPGRRVHGARVRTRGPNNRCRLLQGHPRGWQWRKRLRFFFQLQCRGLCNGLSTWAARIAWQAQLAGLCSSLLPVAARGSVGARDRALPTWSA